MEKLSLVMIVKNEEEHIERCLESVKGFVDEMIVVDTGSTDTTINIAEELGAKVFHFTWMDDFSAARNFGLTQATGDWILSLDADEYLTNGKEEIRHHITTSSSIGRLKIISNFDDDGVEKESFTYTSRLFPNGIPYTGRIHEQLESDLPREVVKAEIYHTGYYQTNKTERNITLLKEELLSHPGDAYFLYQLGKEYRTQKQYTEAYDCFLASYQNLNRSYQYSANVIVEFLNTLIKLERYEEGIQFIDREKNNMKGNADFHFASGCLWLNYLSQKPNATIEDIQKIEASFLACLEIGESSQIGSTIGTGSFLAAYNLGLLHELLGNFSLSKEYYLQAANHHFKPAQERVLKFL